MCEKEGLIVALLGMRYCTVCGRLTLFRFGCPAGLATAVLLSLGVSGQENFPLGRQGVCGCSRAGRGEAWVDDTRFFFSRSVGSGAAFGVYAARRLGIFVVVICRCGVERVFAESSCGVVVMLLVSAGLLLLVVF